MITESKNKAGIKTKKSPKKTLRKGELEPAKKEKMLNKRYGIGKGR